MQTPTNVRVPRIGGLSLRVPSPPESSSILLDWSIDPVTGGWDNRLGYEKYFVSDALFAPCDGLGPIDSLCIWPRQGGALETILLEVAGTLYLVVENTDPPVLRTVASGRTAPGPASDRTSYVPVGNDLLIFGGGQAPLRYRGWPTDLAGTSIPVYPLGWTSRAAPPSPWRVDVSPNTHSTEVGAIAGVWADKNLDILSGGPLEGEIGLGSTTGLVENRFQWQVIYLSDTGSLSPISPLSDPITWITPDTGDWAFYRFVPMIEVPVGPPGTAARLIYRTRNQIVGEDAIAYFSGALLNNHETIYWDRVGDEQLGSEAPGADDSIIFPAAFATTGAVYQGCLFVASEHAIHYSLPGKLEQFRALDALPLAGNGGRVTGLHANYGILLVLRERSIDAIVATADGFVLTPVLAGVGSHAPGSVQPVPPLGGVVFLADDHRIYVVRGGVQGGSVVSVEPAPGSDELRPLLSRVTIPTRPRIVSAWSPAWSEYHLYLSIDGDDRHNCGVVWHALANQWSQRSDSWPIGPLAVSSTGELVFGHRDGDPAAATPPLEAGLFVVSRRRQAGYTVVNTGTEEQPVYTTEAGSPLTSVWRSAWQDYGEPERKKQPIYMDLHVQVMGDGSIQPTVFRDFGLTGTDAPPVRAQIPDDADHPVYDLAVLGTDIWQQPTATVLRVPLHIGLPVGTSQAGGMGSWLGFQVATSAPLVLTGYAASVEVPSYRVPSAKAVL